MTRPLLAVTVASLVFAFSCRAADDRELTGREAEAVSLAVQKFKASRHPTRGPNDIVYGDLERYTVLLERHGSEVQVIFVPDLSPRPRNIPKGEAWLQFGGSTVYGSEVHYHISLHRMKILRETFGR